MNSRVEHTLACLMAAEISLKCVDLCPTHGPFSMQSAACLLYYYLYGKFSGSIIGTFLSQCWPPYVWLPTKFSPLWNFDQLKKQMDVVFYSLINVYWDVIIFWTASRYHPGLIITAGYRFMSLPVDVSSSLPPPSIHTILVGSQWTTNGNDSSIHITSALLTGDVNVEWDARYPYRQTATLPATYQLLYCLRWAASVMHR